MTVYLNRTSPYFSNETYYEICVGEMSSLSLFLTEKKRVTIFAVIVDSEYLYSHHLFKYCGSKKII